MRSVFITVPAYLGRVSSATRCAFWSREPPDIDFDPAQLIEIDLARSPQAAVAGDIAWPEIEVDDCIAGPGGALLGTTLGSSWPELQLTGMVGLEQRAWQELPASLRPPCPPEGAAARDYEFISVVYWPDTDDPRAAKRYAGHHAKVLEERAGLVHVAVYPPGASKRPAAVPAKMWLDLSSVDQCDAGRDSLTRIDPTAGVLEGALFLIVGALQV